MTLQFVSIVSLTSQYPIATSQPTVLQRCCRHGPLHTSILHSIAISPLISRPFPKPKSASANFSDLPREIQDEIRSLAAPLTTKRVFCLRLSEVTDGEGKKRLILSSEDRPHQFLSMCKSSRRAVLRELPTTIHQDGLKRVLRYNAKVDLIMLYSVHDTSDGKHICAPSFEGLFQDAILRPDENGEIIKVFEEVRQLALHHRQNSANAPKDVKALMISRFRKLEVLYLLWHPYIREGGYAAFYEHKPFDLSRPPWIMNRDGKRVRVRRPPCQDGEGSTREEHYYTSPKRERRSIQSYGHKRLGI
jgi:hypothetical protein